MDAVSELLLNKTVNLRNPDYWVDCKQVHNRLNRGISDLNLPHVLTTAIGI